MNSDSSQAMYGGPRNLHFIRVLALDSLTCCRGVRARVRTSSIEGRTYLVVQNLLVFFCSSHVWQRLRTDQTPKTAANPIVVSECATSGRNRANELFGNSGRNRYSCNTPCVVKALEQATSQVDVWQRNGQSHYLGEGRPDRGRMRSRTSNIRVVASKRCELNCWCNKHKPTNPTPCTQKKNHVRLVAMDSVYWCMHQESWDEHACWSKTCWLSCFKSCLGTSAQGLHNEARCQLTCCL